MEEKTEIIIKKIQYLQKLVQDYSTDKGKRNSRSQTKNYPKPTPEQMKEFGDLQISDKLQGRSYFLLSSGKKIRKLHNQRLTRHILDLWVSALINKLLQNNSKSKSPQSNRKNSKLSNSKLDQNGNSDQEYDLISNNDSNLDTDDLINDPGAEEANQIAQNISEDIDL